MSPIISSFILPDVLRDVNKVKIKHIVYEILAALLCLSVWHHVTYGRYCGFLVVTRQ